jgi:uncharacterized OsmC-like protein
MEVNVTYRSGVQFEVEARGHRLVSDQPVASGGQDAGMTPPEFLLASLGTCAMYYAANYLKMHQIPADGMTVHVDADKAANPARLSKFRIGIEMPEGIEERHLEGARRSAEKCLIKNTLLTVPEIELTVHSGLAIA